MNDCWTNWKPAAAFDGLREASKEINGGSTKALIWIASMNQTKTSKPRGRPVIDHVPDHVTTWGGVRSERPYKGTHRPRTTSRRLPTRLIDHVSNRPRGDCHAPADTRG